MISDRGPGVAPLCGIYELNGDVLTIVWGSGHSERPKGFTKEDEAVHTWKRVARKPEKKSQAEEDAVPRFERWALRFGQDAKQVVRILGFYNIEIGVVGGGAPDVTYLTPSETHPTVRRGPAADEQRLYMTLKDQSLLTICRRMAENVGVETDRRLVLLFFPDDLEDKLAELERKHVDLPVTHLAMKTVFGFRPAGNGWEPYVVAQETKKETASLDSDQENRAK